MRRVQWATHDVVLSTPDVSFTPVLQEPDVDVLPTTLDAVSSIVDMVDPGMIQVWKSVGRFRGAEGVVALAQIVRRNA